MSESNGNGSNGNDHPNHGSDRIIVEPFNYLAGNVKGRFEHQLTSRCVAFLGRNRRGKTARLDTVKIGITGKHAVGPHGSDFFQLAPENALTLQALLRGPDGLKTSFVVEVEGGKPRKPPEKPDREGALKLIEALPNSDKLFEHMMPTLSMRDLIKGSTLTREAVFRRFGEISTLPTPRGLTEEQLAQWNMVRDETKRAQPKADTADLLTGMSSGFRKRKLELGREIKALEKLLKERDTALAPAASGSEELPKLKELLTAADAWERAAALRARKEAIEAEAVGYRAKVQPWRDAEPLRPQREAELAEQDKAKRDAIEQLELQVQRVDDEMTARTADYTAEAKQQGFYLTGGEWVMECVHRMAKTVDAEGNAPCLLCSNLTNVEKLRIGIEPRVEARRKAVEELHTKHQALLTQLTEDKGTVQRALREARGTYEAWKASVEATKRREEQEKSELKQEYDRIKTARDENALALQNVPAQYEGSTAAELQARIKALEDAATAGRQLEAEMLKLRKLTVSQELYKLLETEAARELDELLTRTSETANACVNKYMPEGFRAQLDVEEAQWTVIGTDNRPHGKKVMSGSEMGALVPALAIAWTEGAPARYVLLDDEDLGFFDPETLQLVLQSLKDACDDGLLTQVFIAWSRPDEIPASWGQKIYIDAPTPSFAEPPPSVVAAVVETSTGSPSLLL